MITAGPGAYGADDRSEAALVRSLRATVCHAGVTVISVGRTLRRLAGSAPAGDATALVVDLPDPDDARHLGRYSHVVLAASATRSPARAWIEATQPQAQRILYLPSLPEHECEAVRPVTLPEDEAGLEEERRVLRELTVDLASWAGTVWCRDGADAGRLSALVPDAEVWHVPDPAVRGAARRPPGDRAGVVVAALGGFDARSGTDEGAVFALGAVLPALRLAEPDLRCTVVSDGTTARLATAADLAGAVVIGPCEADAVVGGARLLLALPQWGTGQRTLVQTAASAGTPVVVTAAALGGLDGAGVAMATGLPSARYADAAADLLGDGGRWEQAVAAGDRMLDRSLDHHADRWLGWSGGGSGLAAALAATGLTPGAPQSGARLPSAAPGPSTWRPRAKRADGLRPPGFQASGWRSPTGDRRDAGEGIDRGYRRWAAVHGASPAVLSAIAADIGPGSGPLFSVLMPVYNTAPDLLRAAVDSLRAQLYTRWELCIGNDGSDRAATLELLDELRSDPAVRVVDCDRGGISSATNAALAAARGEYVAFLDHDDILKPHALAQMARWLRDSPDLDVVYSDEDILDPDGSLRDVHLKPDWSPDQLMSQNYVCHLLVARRSLVEAVGGLRSEFDGSQDYDLALRLTEATDRVGHVPEPLYTWRAVPGSVAADYAAKPYAVDAGARALADALRRRGLDGRVETVSPVGRYRVRYCIPGRPLVSIVVPTRDRLDLLRRCLTSVWERSTYDRYEVVVVDNRSTDPETLAWLASHPVRVERYPHEFNYARMMNLAAHRLETDAIVFLNNDTEVLSPGWMEALLEHALRPEVGMVGARLWSAPGRPQHEGIMIGNWGDWANNVDYRGYFARGEMIRNTSAVTGACAMMRPAVHRQVGGADPRLRVAYNDVDLCLRLRLAGYEIVYTPYAELIHEEGSTRRDYQHHGDAPLFGDRWDPRAVLDPYYSPVFSDSVPFEVGP